MGDDAYARAGQGRRPQRTTRRSASGETSFRAFTQGLSREMREYLATAHMRILEVEGRSPLQGRVTSFGGRMAFVQALLPQMRLELSSDGGPLERVVLGIVRRGAIRIGRTVMRQGQVALALPGTAPVEVEVMAAQTEVFHISCAASLLEGLPVLDHGVRGFIADVDPVRLQPFLAFVSSLCALQSKTDEALASLEDGARDLARSLIRVIVDRAPCAGGLYERATAIIDAEYTEIMLNTDRIAARLGVSSRTLQAEFARQGTTVMRALRCARVRAAVNNRATNPSIPAREIARISGFGSDSSMFRAIRALGLPAMGVAAEPHHAAG